MGFGNGPRIITDGLVLSLDAGDRNSYPGSGTIWNDMSGNGNNGTLTNGPTYSSTNGGSIVFDGSNDYVSIPNSSTFTVSSVTFGVWFKTIVSSQSYFFTKVNDSFYFSIGGSATPGKLSFWVNGVSSAWLQGVTTVSTGGWGYATATYTNGTMAIYYNGIQEISATRTGNPSSGTAIATIGQRDGSHYFNGSISNFQMYNKALSAQEVLQNYNAQKSRFNL